jgi:hypothetical protein
VIRPRSWGVYRELAHSPGRETDDAEILRATARELEAKGFAVELRTPEEVTGYEGEIPSCLFVMCERIPILEKLHEWETRGARIVNSVEAIRNTYRDRTISLFEENSVPFPPSSVVSTKGPFAEPPGASCNVPTFGGSSAFWVKRADVHSTQEGDVTFAPDRAAVERALDALGRRGIARAVVQEHVPGDLVKFYGVTSGQGGADGDTAWFQWFYHRDQRVAGHPFDGDVLRKMVAHAAACLGLEVYGGDAIATPGGRTVLIDLNAWPSFALYRKVAAAHIAACLAVRFTKEAGVPG